MKNIILFMLLIFATGCSSSLVKLQKIEPKGSEFQVYLAYEYLRFAEEEADQYDWFDSAHFARKGLNLSRGAEVQPENLDQWDISEESLVTLKQARTYLIDAINSPLKNIFPKEVAKAQFLFDCWVEQEEEVWQKSHIAFCREKFYSVLDKLYILYDQSNNKKNTPIINRPAINKEDTDFIIKDEPVCEYDCNSTIVNETVYFEFGSSLIDNNNHVVVSNIANTLNDISSYVVTLNGYADRVGDEDYNLELSKQRALSVKHDLVNSGVDSSLITIYAFGELHTPIRTEDNVPEEDNRAVEVIVDK